MKSDKKGHVNLALLISLFDIFLDFAFKVQLLYTFDRTHSTQYILI